MALKFLVDTGFAGGLLVPISTFESLGLQAYLVPEVYLVVKPDSRRVALYAASREVKAGSSRIRCLVHAAPTIDRSWGGRSFDLLSPSWTDHARRSPCQIILHRDTHSDS